MENIWTTFDNKQIPLTKMEDQHLCNCYWYSKIFYGGVNLSLLSEVRRRFNDKPLLYKPLTNTYVGEITALKERNMIKGTDIVLEGDVIGSIKHLDRTKYTII